MAQLKSLDYYVYSYLNNGIKTNVRILKDDIVKILNLKPVEGLDKYSRELISLATKKRMMMTIENYMIKHNQSYWNKIDRKIANEDLINYIDLFIREFHNPIEKEQLSEIKQAYNNEINKASLKLINKVVTLPNGENISAEDIIKAINKILTENINIDSYKLKEIKYKVKRIAILSSMISALSIVVIKETNLNGNIIQIENNEIGNDIDKSRLASICNNDNIKLFNKYYDSIMLYDNQEEQGFVGYDNLCEKEYQEYIYEVANQNNIPFNVMMTIAHIESGGNFNNNGKISSTDDYGFYQINVVNHNVIYEELGYTSEDLLNDPYKNIDAAALIIKNIYNMYDDPNVEDILGTYNGWNNWREKEISIEYVEKGLDLYQNIYNKDDEQLFDSIENKRKL